ncbi:hypothetical protein MKZ38_006301 [Zalerion maritima]|uniref:Uncharacterized protein n=1 Tax=Zalerion maritima TaxID=339359 RepID=A0AAD5RK47_9PEZI|nr:hypothetical protein MKZ38_006301 [Zalerion maritima]
MLCSRTYSTNPPPLHPPLRDPNPENFIRIYRGDASLSLTSMSQIRQERARSHASKPHTHSHQDDTSPPPSLLESHLPPSSRLHPSRNPNSKNHKDSATLCADSGGNGRNSNISGTSSRSSSPHMAFVPLPPSRHSQLLSLERALDKEIRRQKALQQTKERHLLPLLRAQAQYIHPNSLPVALPLSLPHLKPHRPSDLRPGFRPSPRINRSAPLPNLSLSLSCSSGSGSGSGSNRRQGAEAASAFPKSSKLPPLPFQGRLCAPSPRPTLSMLAGKDEDQVPRSAIAKYSTLSFRPVEGDEEPEPRFGGYGGAPPVPYGRRRLRADPRLVRPDNCWDGASGDIDDSIGGEKKDCIPERGEPRQETDYYSIVGNPHAPGNPLSKGYSYSPDLSLAFWKKAKGNLVLPHRPKMAKCEKSSGR